MVSRKGSDSQGSSRVNTRSAGRVRTFSKTRESIRVRSGQEVFEISRVGSGRVGSGEELFKYRESGSDKALKIGLLLHPLTPCVVIRRVQLNQLRS